MFIKKTGLLFFAAIITVSTLTACSSPKNEDIKVTADTVQTKSNSTEITQDTPKKEVPLAKGYKKEIVPIIEGAKVIYSVSDAKTSETVLTSKKELAEVGKFYADTYKGTQSNVTTNANEHTIKGEKDGYTYNIVVSKLIQSQDKTQVSISMTKK